MNELKKCPVCGSTPNLRSDAGFKGEPIFTYGCGNCLYTHERVGSYSRNPEEAKKAWNDKLIKS